MTVERQQIEGLALQYADASGHWKFLDRGHDKVRPAYDALMSAIGRLIEERDAAVKDAGRYRHMRNTAVFRDKNGPGLYWYLPRFGQGDSAEQLDAAIDATLAAKK